MKKAAIDAAFLEELVEKRSKIAEENGVELDAAEKILLDSIPADQLRTLIFHTPVKPKERKILTGVSLAVGFVGMLAIMASITGPMIGTITGQGYASSTKSAMFNIKAALANFRNDVGRFPHTLEGYNPESLNEADGVALGTSEETNVLVNPNIASYGKGFANMGISNFQKLWKGPYMDADPGEFMKDAWGRKIKYVFFNSGLYLHSSGVDGVFDEVANVLDTDYTGDDIIIQVSKLKL